MSIFFRVTLLLIFPLNCFGTTFSCAAPEITRLKIPEDTVQWGIEKDKDGYLGVNAFIPEKIGNKAFESALAVGSFGRKADILVPLKSEKAKESINFSLMLHESALYKVELLITYSTYDGPCILSSAIYSVQVPHNNARQ